MLSRILKFACWTINSLKAEGGISAPFTHSLSVAADLNCTGMNNKQNLGLSDFSYLMSARLPWRASFSSSFKGSHFTRLIFDREGFYGPLL